MAHPQTQARLAGLLYLATIITGGFAEFFARSGLMISGNASATAQNILAHETLFRLGLASDLLMSVAYISVTLLLYLLLKPVSRSISALAGFFSLIGIAVVAANSINHAAVLVVLKAQTFSAALPPDQRDALAYSFLRLHGQGYNIATVFFGFYCLLIGWLIVRSHFIPRVVGALMMLAGASFLVDVFVIVLAPFFASYLNSYTSIASLVGEGSLTLWLLFFGIDEPRWRALAAAA